MVKLQSKVRRDLIQTGMENEKADLLATASMTCVINRTMVRSVLRKWPREKQLVRWRKFSKQILGKPFLTIPDLELKRKLVQLIKKSLKQVVLILNRTVLHPKSFTKVHLIIESPVRTMKLKHIYIYIYIYSKLGPGV